MCLFHKWSKWETFVDRMWILPKANSQFKFEALIRKQRRTCSKCNKVEEREVEY